MKNCLVLVLSIMTLTLFSQIEVSSEINAVTVFKSNAEITREVLVNVESGIDEIVLTGISTSIIPSSVQIQFKNTDAILLSAKYEKNYLLKKKNNPKINALRKQLDGLNDELVSNTDRKNSLEGMEDILNKNKDLGGNGSSFSPKQVIELIDAYEIKYLEIRKQLIKKRNCLMRRLAI